MWESARVEIIRLFELVNRELHVKTEPFELPEFTVATLPDATKWDGSIIYVSDGAAGQKFRGSDGTTWVNLG